MAAGTALLGILEASVGIRAILLWSGLLGLALAAPFMLLPEPPRRDHHGR